MAEERPISASEIYDSIVGGEGTARLGEAVQAASRLRQLLESSIEELGSLAKRTHEGWQGDAGGLAANQAWLLGMTCGSDRHDVDRAAEAIVAQIDAFASVHRRVLPVPPEPPPITTQGLAAYLAGGSDYRADLAAYRASAENNVRAFAQYHEASIVNGASIPTELTPLTVPTTEVVRTDTSTLPAETSSATTEPAIADTSAPHPAREAHDDTPQVSNPVPPEATSDYTRPAASSDGAADSGSTATRVTPARTAGEHSPMSTPAAAAQYPANGKGDASLGNTEPPRGTNDRLADGADKREPVSGWRGNSREVPANPRGGLKGALARPDGRPAAGSQPGGSRGPAGVPLGATGARRGEEDKERKRPAYLLDPDPDETFAGPRERAVPPVVGEHQER